MTAPPLDAELAALCERERDRLVGLLALYLGDRAVAEELAQETLIRLVQNWPKVRTMANRRGWLSTVAMNLANSWLRRRVAERKANRRVGVTTDRAETAHAEPADVLAVREAVATLPRRQRTALVLRYYARLTVAETAAHMGCPEGTVKALTHRAIARLRETAGLLDLDDPDPVGDPIPSTATSTIHLDAATAPSQEAHRA